MTIRHHISDPLLMAYSAGSLPEAFSLVVATHISMCDECRARLGAFDAIGGALLDRCNSSQPASDSLARVMARIDAVAPTVRATGPRDAQDRPDRHSSAARAKPMSDVPAPLGDYIGGSLSSVRWRPIGMGVRQAILPAGRDASARLLYIPAGQAVPDHGHRGTELTLVLSGAFRDETDRFGPGDLEIADQSLTHIPVAEPGPACICLAATDAPLRFKRLLPRLAQPFFRI